MADEQSKIAQDQLPLYNKATDIQLGSSSTEGRAASTTSTAIETPQPPASNPGSDDATAGIAEGAGGLSSTAHIESPVPNNDKSLLSTVKGIFGFGAVEEVKAEDKGPAEDATTAPASSILAGSAITGSTVAATADEPSSGPTTSSTTGAGSTQGTYLSYQNPSSNDTAAAFPSSQTLPIRSTPGGTLASESTSTTAQKTDTTSKATESTTDRNDVSKSDDDETSKVTGGSETTERSEPKEHKPLVPADGEPTPGKKMENREAIPTAGGKRLGDEHWGQSDVVPDDPGAPSSKKGISSSQGQPTDEVKDNTATNTGGATGGPRNTTGGEGGEQKEKFTDKIKDKLHIGKK